MVGQEELYGRIKDAPWAKQTLDITVGGAGGLGSWVAFFLSRVGHVIRSYDHDVVSDANIGGGQLYEISQIGMQKTAALRDILWRFSGESKFTGFGTFGLGSPVNPICIATFDNMEARMDMFNTWKAAIDNRGEDDKRMYTFINASMLPEGGFIEVIDRPSRAKRWNEEWVPSSDIEELVCTFKATTHNACLMAAKTVGLLNNLIFNRMMGEELRYTPYKSIVDLPLMNFEHEQ